MTLDAYAERYTYAECHYADYHHAECRCVYPTPASPQPFLGAATPSITHSQDNDIQHNGTQHNDMYHKNKKFYT